MKPLKEIQSDHIKTYQKPMFNKCHTLGWPGEHGKGERKTEWGPT